MAVIVFDQRVDQINDLTDWCVHLGIRPTRATYLDPGDDRWCVPYNPLVSGGGDLHGRVSSFMHAIERHSPSWGVALGETMLASFTILAEHRMSMWETQALLLDERFRRRLLSSTKDVFARQVMERFDQLPPEQRQVSSVLNKLSAFLAQPRLRRIFCGSPSLNLRSLVDRPEAILFVALRADRLQEGALTLAEALFDGLWSAVTERTDRSERPQTSIFLDEFQNLKTASVEAMITEGRRYGASLILAHQSLQQLPGITQGIIRNNAAVRVILNPGPVDAAALAGELAPLPRSEAIKALTSLQVGEAFLVRRGQPAVRVQTPHAPPPAVTMEQRMAFREAAMRANAQPVDVIDREIEARTTAFTAAPETAAATDTKEVPHVRHGRKPKP